MSSYDRLLAFSDRRDRKGLVYACNPVMDSIPHYSVLPSDHKSLTEARVKVYAKRRYCYNYLKSSKNFEYIEFDTIHIVCMLARSLSIPYSSIDMQHIAR